MAAAEPKAAKKIEPKAAKKIEPEAVKKIEPEAAKKMTYLEMVTDAIATLKDRTGSSRQAITRHILVTHGLGGSGRQVTHIRNALKTGLEKGVIKPARTTGKGAGCFKIVKEEKTKDGGVKPKKKPVPKKIASAGKTGSISTPSKAIGKNLQKKTAAKKVVAAPKDGTKKAIPKKVAKKPTPSKKTVAGLLGIEEGAKKATPKKVAKKATPSKKATPKKAAVKPVKQPATKKAAKKPAGAKEPKKEAKKSAK